MAAASLARGQRSQSRAVSNVKTSSLAISGNMIAPVDRHEIKIRAEKEKGDAPSIPFRRPFSGLPDCRKVSLSRFLGAWPRDRPGGLSAAGGLVIPAAIRPP